MQPKATGEPELLSLHPVTADGQQLGTVPRFGRLPNLH